MGRDTIEQPSEQEIQNCLNGIKIQAEFYLGKTQFTEQEEKFMIHMAKVFANKNKWIDFYQNILHSHIESE
jgi:hypothetical protein